MWPPSGIQRTQCRFIAPSQYPTIRARASAFSGAIGNASIRRAQEAIEALSSEFPDWMRDDVSRLDRAWRLVRETYGNESAFESLLMAALSIKGMSAMLGYPYSGQICASLVELIEESPDRSRIPLELIGHHVNAVKAELRDQVDESMCKTASALVAGLHRVSSAFIHNEKMRAAGQHEIEDWPENRRESRSYSQQAQRLR